MEKKIHHGRNVARFRQMLGLKQEALASVLGDDWTQLKVSRLEAKEEIEAELLEEIARALKIPADAIRNFDEETAIINIQHNYEGAYSGDGAIGINSNNNNNNNYTFNPIDKLIEAMDEIKRLSAALVKEKDDRIALLERLLSDKK